MYNEEQAITTLESSILMLECIIFLHAQENPRPKYMLKYEMLQERLVANKEDTPSLHKEIREFHKELGLANVNTGLEK